MNILETCNWDGCSKRRAKGLCHCATHHKLHMKSDWMKLMRKEIARRRLMAQRAKDLEDD